MNKIHKFFPIATLVCGSLPFFYYEYLNGMMLILGFVFVFIMLMYAIMLIDEDGTLAQLPENYDRNRLVPPFLMGLILPFTVIFDEIGLWLVLFFTLGSVIVLSGFIENTHTKIKWYVALFLPLCVAGLCVFYLEWDTRKQTLIQNQTIEIIKSPIPDEPLREKRPKTTIYFFSVNGIRFQCQNEADKQTNMDKLLCQDIYQYAGQPAQIRYVIDKHIISVEQVARIVSVQIGEKTLWQPEQTLAWYEAREQKIWREFLGGLLLISLPFLLLYFWARKIVQAA